jgi:hypothetical protein
VELQHKILDWRSGKSWNFYLILTFLSKSYYHKKNLKRLFYFYLIQISMIFLFLIFLFIPLGYYCFAEDNTRYLKSFLTILSLEV